MFFLVSRKEKQDVDNMQKASIKDMFTDQASFDKELSREQVHDYSNLSL